MSKVVASPPLEVRHVPEGIWKQPAERAMPLLKVEVAPEERLMLPPVIVRPLVEDNPPALVEAIPPAKVDVPLFPTIVVVAVPPT